VDHEGEGLESFTSKTRDKPAALKFMKKLMKRHGRANVITTDGLRSDKAAMKDLGNTDKQEVGRRANNRVENSHLPFRRRERASDAEVPADEDAAEVKLRPRRLPQPFQPRPPPHQQGDIQGPTLSRPG
jgi:transposase-like protein